MNDQDIRIFEMFERVGVFDSAHAGSFAPGSLGRQLFDTVRQVSDELEDYAAAKSAAGGSKRQNTVSRAVARETLRDILEAIRRTARAMAFTVPGIDDKFRVPPRGSDQALINAARGIMQEALPLKAEFIRHEMPPTFIEDLQAAIDSLENAIRNQSASKGVRRSAGASIEAAIERGMEAVRRVDPVVRNKFADQPGILSEWHGARHIQRGPRSHPDAGNNNNPAPPAS